MKKNWIAMTILTGMLAMTAACAEEAVTEDSSGTDIASEFPESRLITLGTYDGVEIAAISTEVTEEEIQAEIDSLLASYPESVTVEGKTVVEDGDIVNIDFIGRIDGEAFDGGSSDEGGYDLEIGSNTFIDGFEEGLIGEEVGTTVDLTLTFPDPYSANTELSGQEVVFEVTINAIVEYVTPEWDDAFAQEYTGYETAEAYEEAVRESLQQQKETEAVSEKQYMVILAIIEDSEIECSEDELQSLIDSRIEEYESYASMYGMELSDFLVSVMQTTEEDFELELEEWADFQIKYALVVDAIVKAENLTLSEEEYQEGLQTLADTYSAESAEAFEEAYGRNTIENSLLYEKVLEFVTERAVEI